MGKVMEQMTQEDFLKKALINEQELVRDYQNFADRTQDKDISQVFYDWAEEDGLRANKIKQLLEKFDQ